MSGPGATPARSLDDKGLGDRPHALTSQSRFRGFAPRVLLSTDGCRAPSACLLSTPPLAAILSLALAACATVEPSRPPEVRTQTVEVRVPVPVPCFTEAERPVLPPPTPINLDTATVDQMAAAMAADDLAQELFARAVDSLFLRCMKGPT